MIAAIIAIVAVAAIVGIVFAFKRNSAIKKNGIEADAVVSRIKEEEIERENGFYDVNYVYYVKYQTQDGNTVEAKLNGAPALTDVCPYSAVQPETLVRLALASR